MCNFNGKDLERAESFRMPFGRYHGVLLENIPTSYLRWVAETFQEDIASKADIILRWRERFNIEV